MPRSSEGLSVEASRSHTLPMPARSAVMSEQKSFENVGMTVKANQECRQNIYFIFL
jgi:hypothetical protein